jgi:hypothetical protein
VRPNKALGISMRIALFAALLSLPAFASEPEAALIETAHKAIAAYLEAGLETEQKLVLDWNDPVVLRLSDGKDKKYVVVAFREVGGTSGGLAIFEGADHALILSGWRVGIDALLACMPEHVRKGYRPGLSCR